MIDITFKNILGEEAAQLSSFYEKIKSGKETVVTQQPVVFAPKQGTGYQQTTAPVQTVPVQARVNNTVTQAVPTAPAQQAAPVQQVAPTAVPTTPVPEYTLEQLQAAIAPLMDSGKIAQIQQLVKSFGVNTLIEIPKDRYGELANGLRALGGVL